MMSNNKVLIIKRDSMPARTQVEVDGGVVDIGELRDFSRIDALAEVMASNNSGASFAWTTLNPGQTLSEHKHPVDSMILVCEGRGRYFGEFDAELSAGDIVYVRRNALHGFQAAADSTLQCLSVQFEGRGLYESAERSLVKFGNCSRYDALLVTNELWKARFLTLCQAINRDAIEYGEAFSAGLFGYISRWSTQFQHILFLRQVHTSCPQISSIFRGHLGEEFGHDAYLSNYQYRWDAQLEAYFGWFLNQMYTRADAAKLIIVHMVLESAGDMFSEHMAAAFQGEIQIADYVSLHGELDGGHANIGADIVENYCFSHPADAERACDDGWKMFIGMFSRMHALTLELVEADRKHPGQPLGRVDLGQAVCDQSEKP